MAGARGSGMMNGGRRSFPRRCSGRPIPKRGQVKVGIVVGLASSVASIFSRNRARGCVTSPHLAHSLVPNTRNTLWALKEETNRPRKFLIFLSLYKLFFCFNLFLLCSICKLSCFLGNESNHFVIYLILMSIILVGSATLDELKL